MPADEQRTRTPKLNPMTNSNQSYAPQNTRTEVTCTKCNKATTVPFVPTPGRPVFCRECFATAPSGPRPAFNGGGGGRMAPRAPAPIVERKRMMAQGRKTHFIYDARAALGASEGGMDDKEVRAFLEGLFARGARGSTQDAQVFLEQKVADGAVTHEQAIIVGKLIDKYSFFR